MFSDWGADGAPPWDHRLRETRPTVYDEELQNIIAISRHDIPREWPEDFDGAGCGGWKDMETYLGEALHRMRTGLRKAERRYGNRFKGLNMFKAVEEAVGRAVKYSVEFEGQEFILGYDATEATVRELADPYGEDY